MYGMGLKKSTSTKSLHGKDMSGKSKDCSNDDQDPKSKKKRSFLQKMLSAFRKINALRVNPTKFSNLTKI